jgi:hypothetical protein
MFAARPVDQQVLALTAEVYSQMGDLPRAAAFWYLTDRSGPEVDLAMAAMRERYPTATDVIAALPIRDRIESFPQPVQVRLLALQAAVKDESGRDWIPAPRRDNSPVRPKRTARLANAVGALVMALVLVVFVVGLVSSVSWLVSAI